MVFSRLALFNNFFFHAFLFSPDPQSAVGETRRMTDKDAERSQRYAAEFPLLGSLKVIFVHFLIFPLIDPFPVSHSLLVEIVFACHVFLYVVKMARSELPAFPPFLADCPPTAVSLFSPHSTSTESTSMSPPFI